jgi:hypothetical protein
MEAALIIPEKEHKLRMFIAEMENKFINQNIQFVGNPWELLEKVKELKKIINQVPQPNPRINLHEGD